MIAPLPDFSVVVVDAKAAGSGFDVNAGSLRALEEYVIKQKQRQQNGGDVIAAPAVSSRVCEAERGLAAAAKEFLGQPRTPLCCMTAGDLWQIVRAFRDKPDFRNCVRWKILFAGGSIQVQQIESEIRAVIQESCETREL